MGLTESYVDVLLQSLKKKDEVLREVYQLELEYERLFKQAKPDMEELDNLQNAKENYIQRLNELEQGFEQVYQRVREEIQQDKYRYQAEIQEMQRYIKSVTDLMVQVRAQEERNRQYVEAFFRTTKREIRNFNSGKKGMAQYSQHSAAPVMGQSYFMNSKK